MRRSDFLIILALRPALLAALVATAPAWGQGSKLAGSSPALKQALRSYENKDYHAASVKLHEVIEGQTRDSQANQARAVFWMGKALYHLGFHAASLSFFSRVVQDKKSRYRLAALKWLAALGRKLAGPSGIQRQLGAFDKAQLEQPLLKSVRDELLYLLGRQRYQKGKLAKAIELFDAVSPKSPFCAKAKLMAGLAHVRTRSARKAAEAFKAVLRQAKKPGASRRLKELEELATLNLARLFYSVKQYELAVKYYDRISARSPHRRGALLEQSWAHYQRKDDARALKNLRVVTASTSRLAEAHLLAALIHFRSNRRRAGLKALEPLLARYPPLLAKLRAILKQTLDPSAFFSVARRLSRPIGKPGPLQRLVQKALSDRTLGRSFGYVDELNQELGLVYQSNPAWKATAIAGVVLQELVLRKSLAQNQVGQLARQRIKTLIGDLQEAIRRGKLLKVELSALPKK